MRGVATQKYQNTIYQMVSEVEKRGKKGKNIPQLGFPEDLMLPLRRKLQNSRGQCSIDTVSANRNVNTCPWAGHLTHLKQVLHHYF